MQEAGCVLEREKRRVFFPPELVMQTIAKAPCRVTLHGRRQGLELDLGGDRVYLGTGGAAIKILDLESGSVRQTLLSDIYDIGRLVDELQHIHFYLRPCIPHDIPESAYDVNSLYACLKSTNKHVMAGFTNQQGLRDGVEMASMLAGGLEKLQEAPFISIIPLLPSVP